MRLITRVKNGIWGVMMIKYKIFNKETKHYQGVYSRDYHDEYEFDSEDSALNANCHGVHHDTDIYEIHKVEVTENIKERLPPNHEYAEETKKKKERYKKIERVMKKNKCTYQQALIRVHISENIFEALRGKL